MNTRNLEPFSGGLLQFVSFLEKNRYSYSTIKAYKKALYSFFISTGASSPASIDERDVAAYLEEKQSENISACFRRQIVSALKLFFQDAFQQKLEVVQPVSVSREYRVPETLTKAEIGRLLEATENIKHRAILTGLYSGGLRLSEITALKIADIDFKRMIIQVKGEDGRTGREVMLSSIFKDLLLQYMRMYMPKVWLFEGNGPTRQYSNRSVQQIFSNALAKSGIDKKVSVHTLRHSFATHLLESGTDIYIIQSFLGHRSIKTTKMYQMVAKADKLKILSPMDML